MGTTQSNGTLRVNGRITGTAGNYLVEYGPGTLILNGNSDFVGGTSVNVGTLAVGNDSALGTGTLTMYGGALRSDTAAHTINNAVIMYSDFTVTGNTDLTLTGVVSGAHTVAKTGTGTLVLSGANTFTGGVHVSSGVLAVGGNNVLSTGAVTLDGGAIRSEGAPRTVYNTIDVASASSVTGSTELTLAGAVSGSAPLSKTGSGTLVLTGTNTFTGGVNVVAGTLALNAGSLPSAVTNHAAFIYNGGTLSGLLNNQGTATFNADFNAAGGLSNTGSIILSPGVSLALNAGGLNNQGSLTLSGGSVTGSALVNSSILSGNGVLGMAGGLINNGQITVSGGTLSLASPGSNSNAGNIDIAAGLQLQLTGGTLVNTGTVNLNGGSLTGAGTLNNSSGIVGGHGSISAPLTNGGRVLVDSGILNITTAFANSGEIMLSGGLATLGGAGAITNTGLIRGDGVITKGITNNAGGEIRAENDKRIKFQPAVGTNGGKINLQGGTAEFALALANGSAGQIEGRGTLMVGGVGLTNNGNIALSSGITDVFGDVNNATSLSTKGITISGNADVTFWDDVTNGAGSLFKVSSGSSVTVFGTYSGAGITGNANDIHLEADVSPGFSPAIVDFGGNLHFSSTTRLKIELGGTTAGSQYDRVRVSEQLSLDGVLDVDFIDLGNGQFAPSAGDSFDILDWGTLAGTFAAIDLPNPPSGLEWNTSQLYSTGVLTLSSAGLPGDYNNNGLVDAADYVLWRNGGPLANEVDSPGTVNSADYTEWRARFGNSLGSGAAIPEPGSWLLLLATLLLVTIAERRSCIQFERLGYFFTDPVDSKPGKPVFNRTATLRDTWAKEAAKD
jgi:autotransporter-associated beta strand protein